MKKTRGASLYLALIGLMLAGMGGVFTVLLWKGYQDAAMTRGWPEVPAVVLESATEERRFGPGTPTEFTHKLLYEYQVDGRSYMGERTRLRENGWYKKPGKAQALSLEYAAGQQVTAFVDPEDPERAVLEHETKAPLYSIWFPIVFLLGGLVVVVRAVPVGRR